MPLNISSFVSIFVCSPAAQCMKFYYKQQINLNCNPSTVFKMSSIEKETIPRSYFQFAVLESYCSLSSLTLQLELIWANEIHQSIIPTLRVNRIQILPIFHSTQFLSTWIDFLIPIFVVVVNQLLVAKHFTTSIQNPYTIYHWRKKKTERKMRRLRLEAVRVI